MADTSIQITQGAGTNIDVANPGNGSTYRQVVALGDPNATVAAAIANVTNQALSVGATLYGTSPVTFPAGATITANQGGTWNANVSLQGTGAANVSIQGTVPVTGTVSLANNATVTAFQGASPWLVNASIVGSIPVTGIPGAGATVTAYQGNSPWGVNASIIGTPSVNANVQGTVPVSGTFWQATQPVSGTVTANFGANSTVTAYQGNAPWAANVSVQGQLPVTASIAGIVTVAGNFNVSSAPTITALQGNAPWSMSQSGNFNVVASLAPDATLTAFQGGNWSVTLAGNVSVGALTVNSNSSITAFQGGAPWLENVSIQGIPAVSQSGTWNVVASLAGSATLTAFQGASPWNVNASVLGIYAVSATQPSISGMAMLWRDGNNNMQPASPANGLPVNVVGGAVTAVNASIIGNPTITANQGTSPWVVNATQAGAWTVSAHNVSIAGNITLGALNINNLGPGANIGNVVISLGANATLGMPVQPGPGATITAYQGTSPWLVNASIVGGTVSLANNATMTAFQGNAPWSVSVQPGTAGWTSFAATPLAATIVSLSHTAGEFGGYMLMNTWTSPAYLQVFDATGNVTLGFTAPNIVLPIPANAGTAADGIAANLELVNGATIQNGIKVAATISANGVTLIPTQLAGTIWYH